MKYFDIAPDVGIGSGNACATCCCENATGVPGTTDLWRLNYAAWVIPMGGKGLSRQFSSDVRLLHKGPVDETLTVNNVTVKIIPSQPQEFDFSIAATSADPNLTFSVIPGYEPKNGTASFEGSTLNYKPISGTVGFDSLLFRVTDSTGNSKVGEFFIELILPTETPTTLSITTRATDPVTIPRSRVNVNNRAALIDMAVVIHPTVNMGDIYRITVRANALDCDANCFPHESCYDLTIGKC